MHQAKQRVLAPANFQVELLLDEDHDEAAKRHHVHQGGGFGHRHHPRHCGSLPGLAINI